MPPTTATHSSKQVNFNKIKVIVFGFMFVLKNFVCFRGISVNQILVCILASVSVYLHGGFWIRMTVCVTTGNGVTNRRLQQTSSNIMYFLLCAPAPLIQGVIVWFHVREKISITLLRNWQLFLKRSDARILFVIFWGVKSFCSSRSRFVWRCHIVPLFWFCFKSGCP